MTDCKCEMCSDCFDGLKAQLAAERARADDLSRMVAAMGEVLRELREKAVENHDPRTRIALDAILSRPDVAAERGRWVPMAEVIDLLTRAGLALGVHSTMGLDTHIKRVREDFDAIITERDAAIARAEKAEGEAEKLLNSAEEASMQDAWAKQQQATAERSRDELGIQLAACQERLRLAMDAVKKLKAFRDGITFKCDEERGVHSMRAIVSDLQMVWLEGSAALRALDAVPGDALQPVSAAYKFDIGPALDRAHEASGVVTQKGGEK
jgi:hypothetical protein